MYYDSEFRMNWEERQERKNINKNNSSYENVRTCHYCGKKIYGSSCDCAESKW